MKRRLTDTAIKNLKPGDKSKKVADGGGLFLLVHSNGSKFWRYKYRLGGKEYLYAIGSYSDGLTLAAARREHDWARTQVEQGIHPGHARLSKKNDQVAQAANTFQTVALEWMEAKRKIRGAYYIRQIERAMKTDVFPHIGKLPIKSIQPAQVRDIVKRVESRGAETVAVLVQQWCSAIFRHAVNDGKAQFDPTATLRQLVTRPSVRHNPTIGAKEIPGLKMALAQYGGHRVTRIAVELLMLTFVRTVELRCAEWSEFDLDSAVWHVPAERMKMKKKHIVPLAPQTIALLRELETWTGGHRHLFPNNRNSDKCMSATTINRALERMGYKGRLTGHGLRGTASTLLHEEGTFRSEVIERQQAHAERNKVKAAYNHAEYLAERRLMMTAWANYLDGLTAPQEQAQPLPA